MNDDNDAACDLAAKRCGPCTAATPPLDVERADLLHEAVPEWSLEDDRLEREFSFRNFKEAMAFADRVGEIAEAEGHHPDILVHKWRKVRLTLTTHAIKALSENDFIVAAKIDALAAG